MRAKKRHGHYCKICGQRKSNESFSGRAHGIHIRKACSRLSAKEKSEQMALSPKGPSKTGGYGVSSKLVVSGTEISIAKFDEKDYISLIC